MEIAERKKYTLTYDIKMDKYQNGKRIVRRRMREDHTTIQASSVDEAKKIIESRMYIPKDNDKYTYDFSYECIKVKEKPLAQRWV